MIVDDNKTFRTMIRESLETVSTDILECSDGQEAVDSYGQYLPDWVTMDIEMKGMDGLTATREIKSHHPDAHILFVTQYDQPELREAAHDAGCCAFVSKEDLSEMGEIIGAAIESES